MEDLIHASEQVSLFCRLNINTKKELPIRSCEMGLLIYLCEAKGEKTPMEAARFFHVSKAMATNMVTSLKGKGYLAKEPSPTDRRSCLLSPTPKAVELVANTYDEYFKTMASLKARMGETNFNTLIGLLETANKILSEEKRNG